MKVQELQGIIFEALTNIETVEGHTVFDRFNQLEIGEIVNKLGHFLPPYPDTVIDQVHNRVLAVFPEDILLDYIKAETKDLLRLLVTNKINKEQMILLVFYLMFAFKLEWREDVTSALQNVQEYFYSYIIKDKDELEVEIIDNPVKGETKIVGEYYIRTVPFKIKLIPTKETSINFVNYLYKSNT